MGKLKNLIGARVSGNVGAMSFRRRGADTVVAERSYSNISKGAGASEAQRIHRSRLANIVNFFRVIRKIEARAWEGKSAYVSDFNRFTSLNLANSPIFLTREEAAAGASVIAPYRASRGTLPALVQLFTAGRFVTGVNLSSGFNINEASVAQFSADVIALNDGWQLGDKLSIAQLKQDYYMVAGLQVPQTNVVYFEITLDANNSEIIGEMPNAGVVQLDVDANGKLCILDGGDAAFAIHSRETTGQLLTSEQAIIMANPANAITAKYSSAAQKQAAMDSYGYKEAVLLTPFSEVQETIVTPASVTSVTLAGAPLVVGQTYTEGGELVITGSDLSTASVKVYNGSDLYRPVSSTDTEQTFSIGYSGNYRIMVNDVEAYAFVVNVPEPTITRVKVGSKEVTTAPWQNEQTLTAGSTYSVEVAGELLGELSATGGTLTAVAGDATLRTASFKPTMQSGEAFGDWTIKVGDIVAAAGICQEN